jgi:hypothetical protein
MPAHSSHLLQPLDIGCFGPLKGAYGSLVASQMALNITRIDKCDFLLAYPAARNTAFKEQNIKNSFAAAGLVPLEPDRVISKLNIRLTTPLPLLS